jgi:hypothetical protein
VKQTRVSGKCRNCGKLGHREADCWEKEENKSERPANYKVKEETSASAVDSGSKVEFLLCGVTFPTDQAILLDPNVWIADTAATVHNMPHSVGMTNLCDADKSDAITMGNGISEKAVKIADIKGTMCDKHGVEIAVAKMTDVTFIPTGKYNLFSLTKMMKGGWKLNGDDNTIYLMKDDKTIVFDIKIPTPKGVLYAMYLKREN